MVLVFRVGSGDWHPALAGVTVVVTRPQAQSHTLVAQLEAHGAQAICVPATRIASPESRVGLDRVLVTPSPYDWAIFTSQNGVKAVADRIVQLGIGWRFATRVAAVGPETARCLQSMGCEVQLVPHTNSGEAIAQAIASQQPLQNSRIALLRGQLADDRLPQALRASGASVDACIVYRTLPEPHAAHHLLALLQRGQVDWLTIASGSAIDGFTQSPGLRDMLQHIRIASIGPQTSAAIQRTGLTVSAEAAKPNPDALVAAIISAQMASQSPQ